MKKLYDMRHYITEWLYGLEGKVFLGMNPNHDFWKAKEQYLAQTMPPEQVEKLHRQIAAAKAQRRRTAEVLVMKKLTAAAASLLAVFIVLPNTSMGVARAMENIPLFGRLVHVVTFRNYQYEDDRNTALVEIPKLVVDATDDADIYSGGAGGMGEGVYLGGAVGGGYSGSTAGAEAGGYSGGADGAEAGGDSGGIDVYSGSAEGANADSGQAAKKSSPGTVRQNLLKTTEQINAEIEEIAGQLVSEFEGNLKRDGGYQDIQVQSQVLCATGDYFVLKLICYQGMGSGAEWDYFYTIDLRTGERLTLADLFETGTDYITAVSEDIRRQMKEQMAADESVKYWVDDPEVPEWNFKTIQEDTSFYLNTDGKLVICFDEGEVAPMYMGCVEFEISDAVYSGLY